MRSNRYKSDFNGERIKLFSRSLIGFSLYRSYILQYYLYFRPQITETKI